MQVEDQAWVHIRKMSANALWLEVLPQIGCGSACGASGVGCQTNVFSSLFHRQPMLQIPLPAGYDLSVGDTLMLSLPDHALIRLALMAYGLPLLSLLVGLWLGQTLMGDWLALGLGLTLMLLTWIMLNKLTIHVMPEIHEHRKQSGDLL
jgi:positive regulator of sigma E activity